MKCICGKTKQKVLYRLGGTAWAWLCAECMLDDLETRGEIEVNRFK